MRQQIRTFCEIDDGATAIEYALLATVVAIGAFTAVLTLGDTLDRLLGAVANGVNNSI